MVLFGQKWLYTSRVVVCNISGSIQAKSVLFGQSGCFRQNSCNLQKWLYSGKSCCFGAKVKFIRTKLIVFGQNGCIWAKVVVLGQNWLYLGESGLFGQKLLY